jgi:hypothetical protein
MLIELLSMSNYVSYNIKLAELLGLHAAIYISELMNITDKAIRKSVLNDNYFKLQREYITKRTTLDEKEQLEIEQNLIKLGILEKGETEDDLSLNLTTLTTLLMSTDEQLIDNVKKLATIRNKTPKATKAQKIKDELKTNIVTDNSELREAYSEWIDAVYAKQGWMSKKAVIAAQNVVDNFSNRNLDIALKLLEIASINGYRDLEWAINVYKRQHTITYKVASTSAPRSTELSSEVF